MVLLLHAIYRASRQGLAATLVNLAGYVVALATAWPMARSAAGWLFANGLRTGLVENISKRLAENEQSMELIDAAAQLLENLPAYAVRLLNMEPDAIQLLADRLGSGVETGAVLIVDEVLAPVVIGALSVLLFLLIFSLLMCIVRAVTHLFRGANRIPFIGPANSTLGGVVGLLIGIVSLYVLVLILQLVILITGDALAFLNNEVLSTTITYRLLRHVDVFGLLTARF